MNTDEVIKHYRLCVRNMFHLEPQRPQRLNPTDISSAKAFLQWCTARMVDPIRIIDLRFEQIAFTTKSNRGPRLNDLRAESLVPFARREEASAAATATATPQTEAFDQAVRDLTRQMPGYEQVRRRYYFQQQQDLCIENVMSGGYDPRSHFCPNCPEAAKCAAKLNGKWGFDVVSLRAGRVEQLPMAVRKALRGWDGSVSV